MIKRNRSSKSLFHVTSGYHVLVIPFVLSVLFTLTTSHGIHSHDHGTHDHPEETTMNSNESIGLLHDHDHEPSAQAHVHPADHLPGSPNAPSVFTLWLYGSGSVLLISVFGFLAIMTIPRIASHHHGDILQLLVGLAIGTLTSDALLHLLPHAFSGETAHSDSKNTVLSSSSSSGDHHEHEDHRHTQSVYYGLMALAGIIGFLAFERILTIVSDLCSKSHVKRTKVANFNRADHHHDHHHVHPHEHNETLLAPLPVPEKIYLGDVDKEKEAEASVVDPCLNGESKHSTLTADHHHRETMVYHTDPDRGYVIQVMDHHHHHHQHPQVSGKTSSVIYTIVTGDGLHNFFDGLAIGIAFAAGGIGGGISTSVAVLCHELPHEVGDFAVLLKAGLAAKKAIMYNALSAFLCFIGMTVGILVAKMDTGMLSSIIAGMFLYIALVDMIPQLDCCPTANGTTRAFKLTVQLLGMGIGVTIMSLISIYEPDLQHLMS